MYNYMKRLFYLTLAACVFIGCQNEAELTPPADSTGQVQLHVKNAPQGTIIDDNFVFGHGDQVLMTAKVNGQSIHNTFTYDGAYWTQDTPIGNYKNILWQDAPAIMSIVSYGGKPTKANDYDQSSEGKYIAASYLLADDYIGEIRITGNFVSARLDHAHSDLALKVYDGYDENNTLDEETPVLTVTVDLDGTGSASELRTYTAWNAGKHTDEYGIYTLFRVQLPAGCCILKAELQNVNAATGGLKADIYFRAPDGQPSNEIELERGKRYNASYTYDVLKTVATVDVFITPFEGTPTNDLSANNGWTFDHNTKTYTVFTAEGLQQVNQEIHNNIQTKAAYNITLGADITLPDPVAPETSNWIMLGYFDMSNYTDYFYEGTFDGAGHTIRNLQINDPTANEAALVYALSNNGAVKNLTLENPILCSGNYSAGIAALYSLDGLNCSITNCHIKGGSIKGVDAGGFIANSTGNIIACTVSETTIEGYRIGGIASLPNFKGKIIACGVNEVNFIPSSNTAWVGGIVGYMNASSWDGEDTYIYSCYVKDCTKGTDMQALAGTANMMGGIGIFENCTVTMYNCAYGTKGSSITYGVGGTQTGRTDNDYTVDMFVTQTGMTSTDWAIAASNLNEGIRDWNEFEPTLPCGWEWDTTEEGKLKAR